MAVSGAGAVARNIILTKANAHVDSSRIVTTGTVSLDTISDSRIDATIVAASAGIGVGGYAGVGASVGFALARNYIGFDPTSISSDYDALAERQYLNQGDHVKVTNGDRAGDVYEYVEETRKRWDYVDKGTTLRIYIGDLIKVETKRLYNGKEIRPGIYRSKFGLGLVDPLDMSSPSFSQWLSNSCDFVEPGDLSAADYGNESMWHPVEPTVNAAEVQSFALNSDVTASGDLVLRAVNSATIDAFILSGSVAIGASGVAGVSASGAATVARNKISTRVRSFIDGQLADGHGAAGISIVAHDAAAIDADVIGASISGAVGGIAGVAFSIGVSLAQNEVGNEVEAFITDCGNIVATTDAIVLDARTLPGTTEPADYQSSFKGEIELQPGDTVQAADGHTAGGSVGRTYTYRGYADYVSTDENETGFELEIGPGSIVKNVADGRYYEFVGTEEQGESITDLGMEDTGDTDRWRAYRVLLAEQDYSDYARWELAGATISTKAIAASLALSFGSVAGFSVSGAGAIAQNVVNSKTNAYIRHSNITTTANDDGQLLDSDGDVLLAARNDASISAVVGALSAAVGGGTVGVGMSMGDGIRRELDRLPGRWRTGLSREVGAYIVASPVDAAGDLLQTAISNQAIVAEVIAGSAAVAAGLVGVAGSGAGASARQTRLPRTLRRTSMTKELPAKQRSRQTALPCRRLTLPKSTRLPARRHWPPPSGLSAYPFRSGPPQPTTRLTIRLRHSSTATASWCRRLAATCWSKRANRRRSAPRLLPPRWP